MAKGERISSVYIEDEMKSSYIDYAMSVIVGRALPDVRDGLKPVHRRILYSMNELGLLPARPYRKCARIVGEVLGKYHPHGDVAVYDALVRMAQDFSCRYPLIDGQGNFGSVDGDPPAAMRYTEARMATISLEILRDIEKETVDFSPNFDDSLQEPQVLPSVLPNLLLNGSSGIAVGMATNIPPHNLCEVVDAIVKVIDEGEEVGLDELMEVLHGPDFPTGAYICGSQGIREAYATGRGRLTLRAKMTIETPKSGRENIIITEIPYQVNKSNLISEIAALVREKKIEGIADLRDESDRDGMRIVIELKRGEDSRVIVNQLYKHTQTQVTFGVIMLALVDGEPKILGLKDLITLYIKHRKEIITRKTRFELRQAEARAHILEGLKIALRNLDKVIAIIRGSKSAREAKEVLIETFSLSERQAQAILEMQLQRLTGLERRKIDQEYLGVIKDIERYRTILSSEVQVFEIIKHDLLELKEKYGDERKTKIVGEVEEFGIEDLIVEEDMVVTISHRGYIKRIPTSTYRSQKRGGRGVTGMETREEDFVEHLFVASTHDFLLLFTTKGKAFCLKVHEIPEAGRLAKGKSIVNIIRLEEGEKITAYIPIKEFVDDKYLIMATKRGIVKKSILSLYGNTRRDGVIGIILGPNDELVSVSLTDGVQDVVLATNLGKAIRFSEREIRPMGRVSRGVKCIRLGKGSEVIGMEMVEEGTSLLTITAGGFGKRTRFSMYRSQGRGGSGVINIKMRKDRGEVVAIKKVRDEDEVIMATESGMIIRYRCRDIAETGRGTQGVKLISLSEDDKLIDCAICVKED